VPFSSRFLKNLRKQVWSLLPLPVPDLATAIRRMRIDEAGLRASHEGSPLAREADTFVLYRIVGNDLPPRHSSGQSLANLRFILENEPALPQCEKRWVVNRIVDAEQEAAVLHLLRRHDQPVLHIPFVPEDYTQIGLDFACLPRPDYTATRRFARLSTKKKNRLLGAVHRLKNNYVMNNNGARNAALADGRSRAKWVLPFDGNCFFTSAAWDRLVTDVTARPWLKYFAVPMARLLDNRHLFDPAFAPPANEEPQLLFRRDARESFNPAFPYGRRPKVELFWRLGIPGPWDLWTEFAWDQPRRPLSPEAFQFGAAGWVARLFSGVPQLEVSARRSPSQRGIARQEAILSLLHSLDEAHGSRAHPTPSAVTVEPL
jgi:hypothetical protein